MAKTLLLADDSVTIQKVVSISFASEDVTLVTVDNGDDAVERAKEVRPDLILADVVMPGKSGYEVCETIKADPDLRHIPVLLLSGTFEAFDEERAALAGAAGHVAKPFEAQSLVDQVNRLLSEPSSPQTSPEPPPVEVEIPAEVSADASAADSFDFFDDDLEELDSAVPEVTNDAPNMELSDEAFGMVDEDFAPAEVTPTPEVDAGFVGGGEAYPDRTLAIMPDDDPPSQSAGVSPTAVSSAMLSDESDIGVGELVATVEEESDDSFVTADPSSTSDEAFDFSFESESTAPESIGAPAIRSESVDAAVDELVEGTVLDPIEGVGFDVDPMSQDDYAEVSPPLAAPVDAAVVAPVIELEDVSNATQLADGVADYEEIFAPAELEIVPEGSPDEVPFVAEPVEPTAPPAAIDSAPTAEHDSAARAEAILSEISPDLREALHDTLEKIAWEAFGDVTDKIVREVVDRVEKVAWEVVPQLTETLIKAEIQRLKGDDD